MIRSLLEEIESDFFAVHECIVHGVLNKCRVNPTHNDYDDYLQIGRLALVKAYESFPDSLVCEEHMYQFTGFAYQKIYWAIIDELRKERRNKEVMCQVPDDLETDSVFTLPSFENTLVEETLLTSFIALLSKNEQIFITESVINQLTITEIAKKYQVSRKTVYAWRTKAGMKYSAHKKVTRHEERNDERNH
ncbi:MAG: sigma-70 family RNA polymerase sigma factor [Alkalibacterium sp.]|nr:sigma-70 family RNA polymerase sigma factor [Alkalibacterium sp.]